MITVFLFLALIIAAFAVIFALQNTVPVTVAFFMWQFDQSLALVLLSAMAIGVLVAVLTMLPAIIRGKWRLSGKQKKINTLEKNLTEAQAKVAAAELRILELTKPVEPVLPATIQLPESTAPAVDTSQSQGNNI